MYRKNSTKKGYKKSKDYLDIDVGGDAQRPPREDGSKDYDDLLSRKALKDLPKHPVTLQADPYTNALPGSLPYPLLNKFQPIYGGRYSGDKNLDGGNVKQYANSVTSKFLEIFDTALMKLHLNYRYLPILTSDTQRGSAMIDEMRKAISEACSVLASTTFTQQNIYNYIVETDMPMGSAVPRTLVDDDGVSHTNCYTDIQDVIYATGIMYQLHIQSVLLVFNQFNAFRLKQGEMIRMSFNRETPGLNAYFGLMNKKAFLSLWDSLAYTVEGEYVDNDAMVQTNMLGLIASRRSESMNDSVLEIASTFNYPDMFKMYFSTTKAASATDLTTSVKIFDTADMSYTNSANVTQTFYAACHDLMTKMTINDTLLWVRTLGSNNTSDNDRYNQCKFDLDTITYCMTYFKTSFNDFRSILDVMNKTGVNQWVKGIKLKVIKDTDSDVNQNLIVDNIYSMVLGGCNETKYDDSTKRWSLFTIWNQYYGIPEHDAYSGGSFLTLSTKVKTFTPGEGNVEYMPVAFDVITSAEGTLARIVSRKGVSVPITYEVVSMNNNYIYSRLIPLTSQNSYQIRVPQIYLPTDSRNEYDALTTIVKSFVYKWMLQVTGSASVPSDIIDLTVDPDEPEYEYTWDYGLDSDIFSVYDIQIEDFTNEVIAYARSKSIFRANAIDKTNLGFYGLSKV